MKVEQAMGVCQVVAELAHALSTSGRDMTPCQKLLVYLLRAMPLYCEVRRLDIWERVFSQAACLDEGDQSPVGLLIDGVFDLGSYNLYTAFDALGTRSEFSVVARQFVEAGIAVPAAPELSDW